MSDLSGKRIVIHDYPHPERNGLTGTINRKTAGATEPYYDCRIDKNKSGINFLLLRRKEFMLIEDLIKLWLE